MSRPDLTMSIGNCNVGIWIGEYKGKTTYSYKFTKRKYPEGSDKAEFVDFFTPADMASLGILVNKLAERGIKTFDNRRPSQQPPQPPPPQAQQPPPPQPQQQSVAQDVQQSFSGTDVTNNPFDNSDIPF